MIIPKKLPNFMCKIIGHKNLFLSHEDWQKLGIVSVCLRCGRGYALGGWNIPSGLEQLRRLHPEEAKDGR